MKDLLIFLWSYQGKQTASHASAGFGTAAGRERGIPYAIYNEGQA